MTQWKMSYCTSILQYYPDLQQGNSPKQRICISYLFCI